MNPIRFVAFLVAVVAPLASLRAQDPEAMREIQEIARRVDEQLQEIDRLLLESGKKGQARSKPKDLLQQARQRSESVEGGIDELIDKLNQMKNQSGGGSGQPDEDQQSQGQQGQQQQRQQQQQQQGQQSQGQQGQQNRRENQTPDLVDRRNREGQQQGEQQQGQQQPGQQQGQQPQGQQQGQPQDGKPEGGQESKDGGQNRPGSAPDDGGVGPANPATGDGTWGELQPYMNFMKNRGSRPPQVPEKFRKYWEAYLKQKQAGGAGSGGGK